MPTPGSQACCLAQKPNRFQTEASPVRNQGISSYLVRASRSRKDQLPRKTGGNMKVWNMRVSQGLKISLYLPLTLLLAFFGRPQAIAQTAEAILKTENGIRVHLPKDALRVEVCNDSVLHVTAGPGPELTPNPSPSPWIASNCKSSEFSVVQVPGLVTLKTSNLQVRISLQSGELSFFDGADNSLFEEQGDRSYEPLPGTSRDTYRVADSFRLVEDEAIYGLGQHQAGTLNYRGSSVYLSQKNTDVAVPVFVSTRGYGVVWNTASSTLWDNRLAHLLTLNTSAAKTIDYYFIYGPEADQIIHHYRELTGHAPMFGRWAYGLFQSKDRYKSQSELLGIAKEYRNRHIPLDTIVQDWFWWTKQGSSEFSANYPNFPATLEELHRNHFHAMISIWPNFDADAPIALEMKSKNWLIPGTLVYDATNPAAQDLFWKMLAGPIMEKGIDAFRESA